MTARRHFIIEGTYMGNVDARAGTIPLLRDEALGQALFCPLCAEVWALMPVDGEASTVRCAFCAKHAIGAPRLGASGFFGYVGWWEVPGSILIADDLRNGEWQRELPPQVIERELFLHLHHAPYYYEGEVARQAQELLSLMFITPERKTS